MATRSLTDAVGDISLGWPAWAQTLLLFTAERLESEEPADITVLTLPANDRVASAIAAALMAAELKRSANINGSHQKPPPPDVPVSYLSGNALRDAERAWVDRDTLRVGRGTAFMHWWGTISPIPIDVAGRQPYKILETVNGLVDELEVDRLLLKRDRRLAVQNWTRRFVYTAGRPVVLCGTPDASTQIARLGAAVPPVGPVGASHKSHGRTLVYAASTTKTIPQARLTILDGHVAALTDWHHCPRPVLILLDRRRTKAAEACNELEMHGFDTAGDQRLRNIGVEEMHLLTNPRTTSTPYEDDGDDPL